jgi:hypothetical protein
VCSIKRIAYNEYLHDSPHAMCLLETQPRPQDDLQAQFQDMLTAHHNRSGVSAWPVYDAEAAASYHSGFRVYSGSTEYLHELRMGQVLCSLPIPPVPHGLRSALAVYLQKFSPDWVATPEGKCGASDTVPFTMDMESNFGSGSDGSVSLWRRPETRTSREPGLWSRHHGGHGGPRAGADMGQRLGSGAVSGGHIKHAQLGVMADHQVLLLSQEAHICSLTPAY